jgi:tetratricopeptide (TPR) repeat protein
MRFLSARVISMRALHPFSHRLSAGLALSLIAALVCLRPVWGQEDPAVPAEPAAGGEQQQFNPQEELEKAQKALADKDYETALAAFDRLARAGEQVISQEGFQLRLIGYTGRAQALAGMKEYEAALEDFKQATDLQADFPPALLARGQMYLDMENPEYYGSALADFQKAVKAQRGNLQAQFGLGKAYVLLQGWQQGIGPLTRVIDAAPENATAEMYRLRGTAYANTYKLPLAHADFQKSLELDPEDYETYFSLGILYLREENYKAAAEEIGKSIEHYKPKEGQEDLPFVQGYLTRSSAFIEQGKSLKTDEKARTAAYQAAVDEADSLLKMLDEKNPNMAAARAATIYSRGLGERMLGKLGKAIQSFSEAIEINPDLGEAYFRRGICYHLTGEEKMAIRDFVEAANINYDDPRASFWEGLTWAKLGNYHEAIRAYGNAITASDRYTPAHLNRGLAYMALGEYEKAIDDFSAAIRLEPAKADYYFKRGLAHERLGNDEKASESHASAIEFDTKHAAAHRHMASVMQRLGRTELANEYRQKAEQLAPQQNVQ